MGFARKKLARIGAAIVLAALVLWFVVRLIAWTQCGWYGYQTARETRYAAFIGCMVKINDQWIPRNEIRVVQ